MPRSARDQLQPVSSRRPPPTAHPTLSAAAALYPTPLSNQDPVTSDSAIEASSPPMSAKAQGKQRAVPSGQDDDATPIARRTAPGAGAVSLDDEDEDADLPSVDELVQQAAAKKLADEAARKKEAFRAKVAAREAAAKAAKAAAKGSDSDSDIEIEGAPGSGQQPQAQRSSSIGVESPRLSRSARKIRDLNGPKWGHHTAPVTESQLDRAAHTFGANLGDGHHVLYGGGSKAKRPKAAKRDSAVGKDELEQTLQAKIAAQNHAVRIKKDKKARAKQHAADKERAEGGGLQGVDMGEMLKDKQARVTAARERGEDIGDDDSEDGDYQDNYADDPDLEIGSGSDGDQGSGEEDEDEGGSGSEKENDDPNEGAPDGDKENRKVVDDEDDEQETSMSPPAPRRRTVRVLQSDDEDDDQAVAAQLVQPATPAKDNAPAGRIALPDVFGAGFGFGGGDDDGGFSQFFGDGLSQEDSEAGFRRPTEDDAFMTERAFMNPINISEKERLEDAQQLEAQAVFKVSATPNTPRESEPPRQYINKHGFMTQTRPVNLYEDSPGGSQPFSQLRGMGGYSQTQQQTPTAKGRRPLGRLGSLLSHRESSELELESTEIQPHPTELEPTVMEPTEVDQQADEGVAMGDDLALPSAAQPSSNVFETMKAAQAKEKAREEKRALRRSKNAFIENEADLSEDELLGGMAGLSGDENEDGLDAELESLVDNEEVDRDLQDEQDVLARERHAQALAEEDAKNLLHAQRVVDGKERMKRKNGGVELSDDDFDDDDYGTSKRDRNRARAENRTIAELHADEETQAFASNFNEGLVVPVEEGQYSFLAEPASDQESEGDTDREEEQDEEEEEEEAAPRVRLTAREADRLAVEESRKRKLAAADSQAEFARQDEAKRHAITIDTDDEDDHFGLGSPQSAKAHKVKLITRASRVVAAEPAEYGTKEVRFRLLSSALPRTLAD